MRYTAVEWKKLKDTEIERNAEKQQRQMPWIRADAVLALASDLESRVRRKPKRPSEEMSEMKELKSRLYTGKRKNGMQETDQEVVRALWECANKWRGVGSIKLMEFKHHEAQPPQPTRQSTLRHYTSPID